MVWHRGFSICRQPDLSRPCAPVGTATHLHGKPRGPQLDLLGRADPARAGLAAPDAPSSVNPYRRRPRARKLAGDRGRGRGRERMTTPIIGVAQNCGSYDLNTHELCSKPRANAAPVAAGPPVETSTVA